jgi:hypothetical protein
MSLKPRTLRYADAIEAGEQRIVDALPDIIDALISRAKDGDLKAAAYLCDRICGRTAGAKIAPADDRELPYTEESYTLAQEAKKENDEWSQLVNGLSGRNGARRGA